ncbi:MAG: hypothetical protein P8Y61_08520 [Gammaproteobacteria bacterium]|jgi:hypothetical protein
MNGQVKQLIPGLIGIFALLLTAIVGISALPSEQKAIQIAETGAITLENRSQQKLAESFHTGAAAAAIETGMDIAADLAVDLKRSPSFLTAMSERPVAK